MSRGLGALQRGVLGYLHTRGPGIAESIAHAIAMQRRGLNEIWDVLDEGLPRSELVAVRRAIHSLAARGLVKTVYTEPPRGHGDRSRARLWCCLASPRPRPDSRPTLVR